MISGRDYFWQGWHIADVKQTYVTKSQVEIMNRNSNEFHNLFSSNRILCCTTLCIKPSDDEIRMSGWYFRYSFHSFLSFLSVISTAVRFLSRFACMSFENLPPAHWTISDISIGVGCTLGVAKM